MGNPANPEAPRCFGYVRVSTKKQGDGGSPETQRQAIREHYKAKFKGQYEWGGFYQDAAVSAGKDEFSSRKHAGALIRELRSGDVVVFTKLDRAFRMLRDALNVIHQWDKRGVRCVFLDIRGEVVDTSSWTGKTMIFMMGWLAEAEFDRLSERQRDRARHQRETGQVTNGPASYGYKAFKIGRQRLPLPDVGLRVMIGRLVGWIAAGWTYEEIHKHLKAHGCTNPRTDRLWRLSTIKWYVAREMELREREEAAGCTPTGPWLLPNGSVKKLDDFHPKLRESLRDTLAKSGESGIASSAPADHTAPASDTHTTP